MKENRIEDIKKKVEKEFPGDFALQQIHIARKLLSYEAKKQQMPLWKYIKKYAEKTKNIVSV